MKIKINGVKYNKMFYFVRTVYRKGIKVRSIKITSETLPFYFYNKSVTLSVGKIISRGVHRRSQFDGERTDLDKEKL